MLLSAAAGLLLWLAFPPAGLWLLAPLAVALHLHALRRSPSLGRAAAAAFLFRAVFSAALSFSYTRSFSAWLWLLHVLNWGLLWALFGAAFHQLRAKRGEAAALLASGFLWVLFDRFGPGLTILPSWIPVLANALSGTPLLRLAPVIGIYGLSFLTASIGAACMLRSWRALGVMGICAVLASLGSFRKGSETLLRAASAHVQELDPAWAGRQMELLPPAQRSAFLANVAARLDALLPKAELIVLPEDAIDLSLSRDRSKEAFERWGLEDNGALVEAYRAFARRAGAAVSVGMTTRRDGGQRNSTMLIGPDGDIAGISDKAVLMPGSEKWLLRPSEERYVAGADPFRMLRVPAAGALDAAASPGATAGPPGSDVGAPICLEGQIPSMALGWKRRGAAMLIFSSNSQWFEADPGVYNRQVLGLVRLQAAAYSIPFILAGKLGWLGWVDASGRPDVIPAPALDAPTQAKLCPVALRPGSRTPASRWGEYFVLLSALGLAAIILRRW